MHGHGGYFHSDDTVGKVYDKVIFKRLLKYTAPYLKYVVIGILLLITFSLIELLWPQLVRIGVDDYILNPEIDNAAKMSGLYKIGIVYFVSLLLFGLLKYLMMYITYYMGQSIIHNIRVELFAHIEKLSINFFTKNPVGRLVTRVTNDVEQLNELFTAGIVGIFGDFVMIFGIIIIMIAVDLRLALISLSILPLLILAIYFFRKTIKPIYRAIRKKLATINSYTQENISGMKVVQIFNREAQSMRGFDDLNKDYFGSMMDSLKVRAVFRPVVEDIAALAVSLILWTGGIYVFSNSITLGVLIIFLMYSRRFYRPLMDLSEKYNIMQNAMIASERIFKILDTKEIIEEKEPVTVLKGLNGKVEFKNVSFYYNPGEWILRDISFKVEPGESVALVGLTGAGKTTIAKLINRFYDVQRGKILVDDMDIKNINKDLLRQNIAYVPQDFFLFAGDVITNIKLWDKGISEKQAIEAAKRANIDKFIDRFPKKYHEPVVEGGNNFSTGQKQLISFARALAFSPKILILDEATSNIDTQSETLIQDAISKMMKDRTSIIIAHRLSTIKTVDRILVIHKGKIAEQGNHNTLIGKKGIYYNLYQMQWAQI